MTPITSLRTGNLSIRLSPRGLLVSAGLIVTAVAGGLLAISTGDFPVPIPDVIAALTGQGNPAARIIVADIRAPRVLTALLVGAAFGVSGALFQSLTRNPLGSPDFLGFTSGAATGGILATITGGTAWMIAGSALLGSLGAAVSVYLLAFRRGSQGYRLVLVGIGVSAILVSVNSYLLTRANINDAATAAAWLTGSLSGRGWDHALPVALALAVLMPLCAPLSRPMRMIEMGDEAAVAMGIPVERVRLAAMAVGVALCGVATAAAGPVAFVALTAPQIARRLTHSPGVTLVTSGLMGAVILVLADLAAQRLFGAIQFPVGVLTAALGGAYLALLLRKERR
ncbi:iron chelate uptake ABC transporter family permease subunit [Streptosporangium sp. KLBMP 9127]|nr:iron chelate uptake ABC transporter family permease subunit [Streptosporangium sp. KLBMP 9127]